MKKLARNILRKILYQRYYNWWDGIRKYLLNNSNVTLTKEEIQEIDRFHNRFTNLKLGYTYYKTVKAINNHFDINYIQDTLYYSYILRHLNPYEISKTFANKGFYGFYFETFSRPFEPARKINGFWFDTKNRTISEEEAIELIIQYQKEIIVKPAIDSGCGRGIDFYENYDKSKLKTIFLKYKDNFVVQGLVSQSEKTKVFNPTSLNSFRITTLSLNGRFSILSRCLKTGAANSKIDNIGTKGDGGVIVGIESDGNVHPQGIKKSGEKSPYSSCGVAFEGHSFLKEIKKIDEFAENLHQRVPFCSIIGWDICLDEQNKIHY